MSIEKRGKIVLVCSIVAAIAFGIASYVLFLRGRMKLGWIFAILTVAQLVLAVMNCIISKKTAEPEERKNRLMQH
ncbi:MAG: hypothetical protein ACI4LP_03510 [Anaerovoracaceae bacterium]